LYWLLTWLISNTVNFQNVRKKLITHCI